VPRQSMPALIVLRPFPYRPASMGEGKAHGTQVQPDTPLGSPCFLVESLEDAGAAVLCCAGLSLRSPKKIR
jgi:hypothetical protein